MILVTAKKAAKAIARTSGETAYVVFDPTRHEDARYLCYWPATLEDTETFYQGCYIELAVSP